MLKYSNQPTLTFIFHKPPVDNGSIIHNLLILLGLPPFQLENPRSGQKLKRSVKTGFRRLSLLPVSRVSCRKSAFSAANELCGSSPKLPKAVEFLKKLSLEKIDFLSRPMSVLHVRIVDFDLQITSYPLVLSYLNLEFGKAVEISLQDHAISAK